MTDSDWWIRGTYLEACNCEPICPCRRIDGAAGGRSTFGECMGVLSWKVAEGQVGDVALADLAVVIALWYSDDEPGSPWTWRLFLDERADADQREALEAIFTGRLGGPAASQFPWAFKPSTLVAVVPTAIEIDHTPGRGWLRAGGDVTVRIREPYAEPSTVSCVIPGHHRAGREVVAETLEVDADPLRFEYSGRCGYEATFEYASG